MKNVILFWKELFEYFSGIDYFIWLFTQSHYLKKKKRGFDLQCASFAWILSKIQVVCVAQ